MTTLQFGKLGRCGVSGQERMPTTPIARSASHGAAPSFARNAGPACTRVLMEAGISFAPKGAVKLQMAKNSTNRHHKNARWVSAAAAVEPDLGDEGDTGNAIYILGRDVTTRGYRNP
eukprot:7111562-Pyramimonas_sp.AAC.1